MAHDERMTKDFVRDIVDAHLASGRFGQRVHTRFPPEPNGYLHIGHAKSIVLNFGIAEEYGGKCNVRFDDTNPVREEEEFVDSILEDVRWLGYDWEDRLFYASDYFDQLYEWAVDLIRKGWAYVDDQTVDEIRAQRGDLTTPGTLSPFRDRSVDENLDLFARMRAGEFAEGERVLRAKVDMSHPNMNMRDPIMYRVLHATHHNTGDRWCIYPSYDWAHGQSDSIEGITQSICTLEFENHRPLYDWLLDRLGVHHPQQIEFARLNISYTVLSKRRLRQMVEDGLVSGWDDPRMPTLRGMRRRGYPPAALRDFLSRIGVAKVNSTIAFETLEHSIRDHLNRTARRFMGVLDPLPVTIENLPADLDDTMDFAVNPEDPGAGTRAIPFSADLVIERDDFMEDPPKGFHRLAPGREVRLRNAYLATCTEVVRDGSEVTGLVCRVDPGSRGGNAPDGRRVKGTIHWVSVPHAVEAEVRLFDRLFTVEDPMAGDGDFMSYINPDSLVVRKGCKVEPAVTGIGPGETFQFERLGYFCVDPDTTDGHLVINRTITLRDTWARIRGER
ncbi:MAG: glutamine--tRNA ligase/YqeY domain fusion protein [Thermoplasmata archaeon]|nr:glutamine--tRNA ligase/YqeY domain fusion protein [Thermoplasmata archaeon]